MDSWERSSLRILRQEPIIEKGYMFLYFPQRDVTLVLPSWTSDAEDIKLDNRGKLDMEVEFDLDETPLPRVNKTVPVIFILLTIPIIDEEINITTLLAQWIWDIYKGTIANVEREGIYALPGRIDGSIKIYFQKKPVPEEYLYYSAKGWDNLFPNVTPGKRTRLDMEYPLEEDNLLRDRILRIRKANADEYRRGHDFSVMEDEDMDL